jgi:hypothetical protein
MDRMSKDELIKAIEKYGCGLLKHLPLKLMTKEAIVEHLEECKCPKLQDLKKTIKD